MVEALGWPTHAGARPRLIRPLACLVRAVLLSAPFLVGGCGTTIGQQRGRPPQAAEADRLCAPRAGGGRPAAPLDGGSLSPEAFRAASERLSAQGFSRAAIEIADVIGAAAPLLRLGELEAEGRRSMAAELRVLRLRQAVTDRIMLAMLDVSGTLAAIDCEGERGDQLRVRLQGIESRRARRLGLASIMVGALTAALSGGLSVAGVATAGDIAGITGGVAEASVGASLLFGSASGTFRTERNLLREVWERPARSELFPPSVWRFLTRRPDGDPGRATVAEVVVNEWRAAELLGRGDPEEERSRAALLFGPGGTYGVGELEARDAMLDLLEASVALMSRDLRHPAGGADGAAGDDDGPGGAVLASREGPGGQVGQGGDQRGGGQGDHPGDHDVARDAPAHRRGAARGADADDGAGDGVRGRDRNAEAGRREQGDGAARSRRRSPASA